MEYLFFVYVFVFGLLIGSFVNCLVWRLHKGEGLWNRSYCPKCRGGIAWYDNIPIFSYLILRAKCRHCKAKISCQYPVVELAIAILFTISFILNTKYLISNTNMILDIGYLDIIRIFRDWFFIFVMIVVFIYDLRYYLILDVVTFPAMAVIFVFNLLLGIDFKNMLISAIIGGSFFLLQFLVSRGKWIGGGDIRLGFLLGLFFAWPNILAVIFLAYIIGSLVSVPLVLWSKKKWSSEVPLGVFLTSSAVIVLFWGENVINWYLNLLV